VTFSSSINLILLVPGSLGIEASATTSTTSSMARVNPHSLASSRVEFGLVGHCLYIDACLRATISQNARHDFCIPVYESLLFLAYSPHLALFAIGYLVGATSV
jgi:hypothetical protein